MRCQGNRLAKLFLKFLNGLSITGELIFLTIKLALYTHFALNSQGYNPVNAGLN